MTQATTTQQAASAAPGVQATQTAATDASDESSADAFQSLYDDGAFAPTTDDGSRTLTADEQRRLEQEAQGGQQTQQDDGQQTDQTQQTGEQQQTQQDDGEDYESLDAYLTKQKLDPESFMQLPVTVKVDGAEQAVPLAEVVKGYQLSQASYNRMNELATQRTQFTQEQTTVRQALGVRIQQTEAILKAAQEQLIGQANQIDWNKLRAEDPAQFAAASLEFQGRQQALQQIFQQVQQARQQDAQQAEQSRLQAIPVERERLLAARPEWRDPAKFAVARDALIKAGRQLGFTDAELGGVTDHRHLIVLDLAARALKNQASRPEVLKRVRAAPRMAAPGTRQARDPARQAATQANDAWKRSGYRDDNAAAAVFERFT